MAKTLKGLREQFPTAKLYIFRDGCEVRHEPFLYTEYRDYERKVYQREEDGDCWEDEVLYINL